MNRRPADRTWPLMVLVLAFAVTLAGCAKKTPAPDVTKTTPEPVTEQPATPGDQTGNPADNGSGDQADKMLKDVFFNYNDHTLSEEARSALSGNASYLREMGSMQVTVEGHCDERGTVEYNLALGQRRAESTRAYLVDLGIESARLSTISYGEERPFEFGHDEAAWSQNRRAHFRVINP